jgi:hypothetical protein
LLAVTRIRQLTSLLQDPSSTEASVAARESTQRRIESYKVSKLVHTHIGLKDCGKGTAIGSPLPLFALFVSFAQTANVNQRNQLEQSLRPISARLQQMENALEEKNAARAFCLTCKPVPSTRREASQ